jgi:hypothetical protein
VLVSLLVLAGCGGEPSARPPVETPEPPPPVADVRFVVNLPAVLLWGADDRGREPDASDELREYVRLSRTWTTPEYLSCRWSSEDLDSFWRCAEPLIPEEHRALVGSVLNDVAESVRPTWNRMRASLRWLAIMLADFLERQDARRILEEVRAFSGPHVFDDPIRVPLVPHGLAGSGRRPHVWGFANADRAVLIEIPGLPATQYFATFVHELVHMAHDRAEDEVRALENALGGYGPVGIIAATRWDEATAHAFEVRGGRSFNLAAYEGLPYGDASVQALSERLQARMEEGPLPPVGEGLAPLLAQETRLARPPDSWVLTDFTWRLVVFSDTPSAVSALGHSHRFVRDLRRASLDGDANAIPAHHSAMVLATADELAAHPQL